LRFPGKRDGGVKKSKLNDAKTPWAGGNVECLMVDSFMVERLQRVKKTTIRRKGGKNLGKGKGVGM